MFSSEGKRCFGFHAGANIWINDLNTRRASPGGDLLLRYGFSRRFSVGVMIGYDRLIALHNVQTDPLSAPLEDYMALTMASADFVLMYNYPVTVDFRPYIYAGIGGAAYLRRDRFDNDLLSSGNKVNSAVHIPVGFGF